MQVKNWMLATAVTAVLASCGEAGSSSDNPDSTSSTSTTKETKMTRAVEVPEATRTAFEAKYPQAADVTWVYHQPEEVPSIEWEWKSWKVDSDDMVAKFKMNEEDYWVWYDEDGNWIGTVAEMSDHASLPAAVNNAIRKEFPGYKIVSVDKENDKDRTAYEVQMEKGEDKMKALIAENGEVMKKKGKVDGEKVKEKN
jgi:hypothetical protein